jgi:hypothetical protein
MPDSRSIIWVDANGKQTITRIRTGGGAGGIQAAILGASNADFNLWWESTETANGAPAPVAAVYQGVQPMAQLLYVCADNTIASLLLPAPQAAVFLADKETIDPANAAIAAITAAAIAAGGLISSSGSSATALAGGKLLPYRGAP